MLFVNSFPRLFPSTIKRETATTQNKAHIPIVIKLRLFLCSFLPPETIFLLTLLFLYIHFQHALLPLHFPKLLLSLTQEKL